MDSNEAPANRKRASKACDACRKAKTRCTRLPDAAEDETICFFCKSNGLECEYLTSTKKRGPPKGHVSAMELKINRMEQLVANLVNNPDPAVQQVLKTHAPELNEHMKMRSAAKGKNRSKAAQVPRDEGAGSGDGWEEEISYEVEGYDGSPGRHPTLSLPSTSIPSSTSQPTRGFEFPQASAFGMPARSYQQPPPPAHPNYGQVPLSWADLASSRRSSDGTGDSRYSNPIVQRPGEVVASSTSPGSSSSHPHSTSYLSPASTSASLPSVREDLSLADMVGQLSLDENSETKFHGKASGYYYIRHSARYKDSFWAFPEPGVAAPTQPPRIVKTEQQILDATNALALLPDRQTADHLMQVYWSHIHPQLPLFCRSVFERQYRATMMGYGNVQAGARYDPSSNSSSTYRIPLALLFAIFSLASRYTTSHPPPSPSSYWPAGDRYAQAAEQLLDLDYPTSRLTSIQALIILAYRDVGCGKMVPGWHGISMGVRMAQDMGLFKEVDKWRLPVALFSWEEKQTRKRTWWCLVNFDRFIASYLGRPMIVWEEDHDVELPLEDVPDEYDPWQSLTFTTGISAPNAQHEDSFSHSISRLNASSRLFTINAEILRRFYAIKSLTPRDDQTLLAQLDGELNEWHASLPTHLSWTSTSFPNVLSLHCQYNATVILLHRPFAELSALPLDVKPNTSRIKCVDAARAIDEIVEQYHQKYDLRQADPSLIYYLLTAGVVHSCQEQVNPMGGTNNLATSMGLLKEMEVTWGGASKQRGLLASLTGMKKVSGEVVTGDPAAKRGHIEEHDSSQNKRVVAQTPASFRPTPALPPPQYYPHPPPLQHGYSHNQSDFFSAPAFWAGNQEWLNSPSQWDQYLPGTEQSGNTFAQPNYHY